jgi:excisionase family DNA binding protein
MAENAERYLMSAKEASQWLGIPVTTLYCWALAGKIPHYKVHKRVLFGKADVIEWLKKYHRTSDPSPK